MHKLTTPEPVDAQPCLICNGTGLRNDVIGRRYRRDFPEYTCNGCYHGPRPGYAPVDNRP